ncbi:MAG: glutamine amidotransferase [Verrucomicrobiota bacterium]
MLEPSPFLFPLNSLATITFANDSWGWVAVGFVIASAVILILGYRNSPLRGPSKWFAVALKAVGLILLALALMEPVHLEEQPKKNANDLAVIADNSSGLAIPLNPDEDLSSDQLKNALITEEELRFPGWLESLGDTFRLQTFLFDRSLRRTTDFHDLAFDRPNSQLGHTLEGIHRRFENRPLAATVLLTDGNATDTAKLEQWLANLEEDGENITPVYPVLVGQANPAAHDLALGQIDVETSPFEDGRVSLTVQARSLGLEPTTAAVVVLNEAGEELGRKVVVFAEDVGEQTLPVRLRLPAIAPGVSFLQIRIEDTADEPKAELTEKNNRKDVVVNQGSGPYRILYISGRPNWEYKFLRRALAQDAEIELVGLIRIAKREPKFEWRGRTGESSNPLFRGFQSDIPEETQKYDEPVFVRLNTAGKDELRDGFPKAEEDLFPRYRAIIIDDVEAEQFTQDQQELIDRFVARRGGTVIMLGGQESFHAGGWDNTPVGRMLPVYLENLGRGAPSLDAAFNLTREGWLESWMRLKASQEEEYNRLAYMTPFFAVNQIRAIKPGASVLATVTDSEERSLPAIITQRYGEGKSAAVTIGDFWRWGLKDAEQQESLGKTWRQLLRWGVNEVPTRVTLEKEETDAGGIPMTKLSVRVRNEKFEAQDNATVLLTVKDRDGNESLLSAEPSLAEPGLFTADYSADDSAGYRIEASVLDGDGVEIGTDEVARALNPEANEFARLGPNEDMLEKIATATGGAVLSLDEVGQLPGLLEKLDLPVSEVKEHPLWHTPWLFLLALAFFAGEWILRRRQGVL